MPIHRVPGGWRWGQSGKVYPTQAQAERQGRAIYAAGYREKPQPIKRNRKISEIPIFPLSLWRLLPHRIAHNGILTPTPEINRAWVFHSNSDK